MESRWRVLAVTLLLLTAGMWGLSGFFEAETQAADGSDRVSQERLIQPTDNGTALWPYTSSGRTVNERTLAINLIVHGSEENVRHALTKRGELDFQPVEYEGENATQNGTFLGGGNGSDNETTTENGTATENGTSPGVGNGSDDGTTTENDTGSRNGTEPDDGTDGGAGMPGEPPTSNATLTPDETVTPNETLTPNESAAANRSAANETNNESQVVEIRPTGIEWTGAHGAVRYTFVDTNLSDGGGRWMEESYQLRSGPYLGSRLHVRAYASPTDDWTALQVHADYWDWFRLRHTVPATQAPARTVESNFIGKPYVGDVSREYYGIEGGGSDGWLSVVDLAPTVPVLSRLRGVATLAALGLLGVVSADTRAAAERTYQWLRQDAYRQRGGILLAGVLATIVLGVRVGGIAIETTFPELHPKLIVATLYPMLAFGMPAVAAMGTLTRDTDPSAAFGLVVVGVGAAFVLDFGVIGVSTVPIGLVLHRSGLIVALGLVAAGTAHDRVAGRYLRLLGTAAWTVGLVLPLVSLL